VLGRPANHKALRPVLRAPGRVGLPMRRLKNTPPQDDEHVPASYRRKKTRRWCKGRVGIEHVWVERDWMDFDRGTYHLVYILKVCEKCGRHGDYRTVRRYPPACDHNWVEHYWCTFGPNRWYWTICSKCDKRGTMRTERTS